MRSQKFITVMAAILWAAILGSTSWGPMEYCCEAARESGRPCPFESRSGERPAPAPGEGWIAPMAVVRNVSAKHEGCRKNAVSFRGPSNSSWMHIIGAEKARRDELAGCFRRAALRSVLLRI